MRRGTLARLAALVAVGALALGACQQRRRRQQHRARRDGQHRDQPVGRLRGQRGGRRLRARRRSSARPSTRRTSRRRSPGRASRTATSTSILENWGHADLAKKYIDTDKVAVERRPHRQQGHHRLVRAAVAREGAPRDHRLEQPQQLRRQVQDVGVRRQGPVPRRRPVVRHQRRGPRHEPQPELQGRLRRQRGRADRGLPDGREAEEAADRLLLRAAVVPLRGPLVQVKLPPYTAGCDADPKKVACDYPPYVLDKIVSKKFADTRQHGSR